MGNKKGKLLTHFAGLRRPWLLRLRYLQTVELHAYCSAHSPTCSSVVCIPSAHNFEANEYEISKGLNALVETLCRSSFVPRRIRMCWYNHGRWCVLRSGDILTSLTPLVGLLESR